MLLRRFFSNSLLVLFLLNAPGLSAASDLKSEPPVPVRTVKPAYPDELRSEGLSGVVFVRCQIDAQGNVTDVEVERSTNPAFEPSAVNALKRWKFKPARQDGVAVAIKVSIPVKFVAAES